MAVHECTSNFSQWVFEEFLGDVYKVEKFITPGDCVQPEFRCGVSIPRDAWLLSQNQFGWPAMRPRHSVIHASLATCVILICVVRSQQLVRSDRYSVTSSVWSGGCIQFLSRRMRPLWSWMARKSFPSCFVDPIQSCPLTSFFVLLRPGMQRLKITCLDLPAIV